MDQTRTRTWSGVPSGVAITGNQDLGTWSRVPLRLLVTRRPADGLDEDEDDGAKDKAKRPTWWLVTRQPTDGPDKNKDWGARTRARKLGRGPGTRMRTEE